MRPPSSGRREALRPLSEMLWPASRPSHDGPTEGLLAAILETFGRGK
jgi:hypothetical protein